MTTDAKNPPQDIANFFATSGWTIQANVNANDPQQADASSTGPQAVFAAKFSAIEAADPYASVKAPKAAKKTK